MGLCSGLLGGLSARELERRKRADELGMLTADVAFGGVREGLLVPGFEELSAPTFDPNDHLTVKTI